MIKDTPIRALQDKPPTWRLEIDATAKETLAARLEATARTSQADYQRTYRARQRNGCRVVSVELTVEREEALIAAGVLNPALADDREAVKRAVERLLDLLPAEVR